LMLAQCGQHRIDIGLAIDFVNHGACLLS